MSNESRELQKTVLKIISNKNYSQKTRDLAKEAYESLTSDERHLFPDGAAQETDQGENNP